MLLVLPVIRKEGPMQMKWKSWRRLGAAVILCSHWAARLLLPIILPVLKPSGKLQEMVNTSLMSSSSTMRRFFRLPFPLPTIPSMAGRLKSLYKHGSRKTTASTESGNYVVLQLQSLPLVDSSVDPHPEDGPVKDRQKKATAADLSWEATVIPAHFPL